MFEMYVKFVESSSKYELELRSVLCTITATCFDPRRVLNVLRSTLRSIRYFLIDNFRFFIDSLFQTKLKIKSNDEIPLYIFAVEKYTSK